MNKEKEFINIINKILNKDSNLDLVLSRDENITILWGDGSGTYDWQNKLIYISPN